MKQSIFMPNEIFNDLSNFNLKNAKHVAFTYTYYYYISYLYRYCKHYTDEKMTQSRIKEVLGLNATEKRVDYIIKQNGILDQSNYTKTTSDYPIDWTLEDGILEFKMLSEHNEQNGISVIISDLAFKVKTPIRAFHRSGQISKTLDGTFYEIDHTHGIPFKVFEKIMKIESSPYIAFYIYGFIKHKNDVHRDGFDLPKSRVKEMLGISQETFAKYVDELKKKKLIYVEGINGQEHKKTNRYFVV